MGNNPPFFKMLARYKINIRKNILDIAILNAGEVKVKVIQLRPMDYAVHGILQA